MSFMTRDTVATDTPACSATAEIEADVDLGGMRGICLLWPI
jgi:hypothetical protein